MKSRKLMREQLERKLKIFNTLRGMVIPPLGWINSIREALGISLRQLGEKMNITAQSAREIVEREKAGTISINSLRQAGKAMGMELIYGFIPVSGSLEKMIEKRAFDLAKEIVMRTSVSMHLEDQGNTRERIQKAISDKAEEIIRKSPRFLWNTK